jgi:aryl-alcohol dehydrogenase-like predicted oxidoreductase
MSFRLLDAFVDVGFNLIDTADVYSHGAPGNQGGVGNDRQVECGQRA